MSASQKWLTIIDQLGTFADGSEDIILQVKVHVYGPDIPVGSADFTLITPQYWNSIFRNLISLWKMQRNWVQL